MLSSPSFPEKRPCWIWATSACLPEVTGPWWMQGLKARVSTTLNFFFSTGAMFDGADGITRAGMITVRRGDYGRFGTDLAAEGCELIGAGRLGLGLVHRSHLTASWFCFRSGGFKAGSSKTIYA